MKCITTSAKTVEKAIEDALKQLGCAQDEVTIRVINEGGLFKKAEVEVTRDNYVESAEEKAKAVPKKDEANVKKIEPKKEPIVKKVETKVVIHTDGESSRQAISQGAKTAAPIPAKKAEVKRVSGKDNRENLQNFLEGIVAFSSAKNASVIVAEEEQGYKATIAGDALSSLIGSSGETLHAIETVLNIISAKNRDQNKRVMLDVGAYKQGKASRLEEQADAAAKRVRETGEPYKMKPMSNRERRVVHAYLQTQKDVKTASKGDEPYRCVVVYKADEKKLETGSKEMSE